ncbi:MAG: HEAT repeat domain-containing protein [Planctomycetes bacterium]|nr:HEAT repeat domain-containing protein [Planctomycetota bacterium]
MTNGNVGKLISQLESFRTRSEAIQQLVGMGSDAIEPLIEALHEVKQEGPRWAIMRCLGQLKAEKAVGHIAPLLEDRQYRTAAHDALVEIVGEDLGPAPQPWLRWTREASVGGGSRRVYEPQMHMTGLPDERLLQLALTDCDAEWYEKAAGRYEVILEGEGEDGPQTITANLTEDDHEDSAIVIVYAQCGPAREEHYEYALKRNLRMPYGALAVRGSGDEAEFVMFNTLLREDMSPLELRKSILAIASRAARVRRDLESD